MIGLSQGSGPCISRCFASVSTVSNFELIVSLSSSSVSTSFISSSPASAQLPSPQLTNTRDSFDLSSRKFLSLCALIDNEIEVSELFVGSLFASAQISQSAWSQ